MSTMLEKQAVPRELRQAQRAVSGRLGKVRRRLRTHLLVEGIFWIVTAVVAAAATSLVLDRLLRFSLPTRLGLLTIAAAAILVVTYQRLIRPLLLPLDNLDLAELLDRRSPGVGQRISNVLQLPDLLEHDGYASPSMVQAAVQEHASALDRVDLSATLNVERRHKLLALGALWLILVAVFCAIWPATASLWARRWLAGSTLRWPQDTYLSILGLEGNNKLLVPRGEMSLLQINARPTFVKTENGWLLEGRPEPLLVEAGESPKCQPPEDVNITYTLADGTKRRGNAAQFDEASFRYELPPLGDKVEMSITGGDDWMGPITIEPIDRPSVTTLTITSRRLGSSQDQTERVGEGSAQLLFLPETQVKLRLVANQPLRSAEVLDKGTPVAGWQRASDREYTLSWTMKDSLALEFRLTSELGGLSSKPYFLAIGLLKDREPRVTIRSSGVGRRITPVARIPLSLRATDDFGVGSLALDWERTALKEEKPQVESKREELDKPAEGEPKRPPQTEINLDYELALRERGMAPGNTLKLRASAADVCALGPQSGSSRWLSFQIVTSEELFYEILIRQREQRAKFGAAFENEKTQKKALEECSTPAEAAAVARAQQIIARQVWQVANQLDASLQEMTLNDLANSQARENLQNAIIAPMRSLHDELFARLRASIDGVAQQPTVSDERRDEAVAVAGEAVEAMQSILAQMSLWESFIDVINQLKQVIDRQDNVLKSTEEAEKKRTDDLFKE